MKKVFYLLVIAILSFNLNAQNIGIGTSSPAASAQLEISSNNKGVLIPRMSKIAKNAISSPVVGLMVFQTFPDSIGLHYYNGSQWIWINPSGGSSNSASGWLITGNGGTDTAIHFIGTTNIMPLAFRVANEKSGIIENNPNTANTFLGYKSGKNNAGNFNTGIGHSSLLNNTTGSSNVAIGAYTLHNNNIGSGNVAIGDSVLTDGFGNGDGNTVIGTRAFRNLESGDNNTAIGAYAGYNADFSCSENTFIGYRAGYNFISGSGNVFIGNNSGPDTNVIGPFSNRLYIDNSPSGDTSLIWGDFAANLIRINGRFDINNYSFPVSTTGGSGKVLRLVSGDLVWSVAPEEASNGLNMFGSEVRLGGTLTEPISQIDFNGNSLAYYLNSGSGFYIRRNSADTAFAFKSNGKLGVGTIDPQANLDINGTVACRQNVISLSNGLNSNINVGNYSFIKIIGPTNNFSIDGIQDGTDGKILTIFNETGSNMQIVDQSASASNSTNRINTLEGGANISTVNNGSVTFQYSAADNRWMVIAMKL